MHSQNPQNQPQVNCGECGQQFAKGWTTLAPDGKVLLECPNGHVWQEDEDPFTLP